MGERMNDVAVALTASVAASLVCADAAAAVLHDTLTPDPVRVKHASVQKMVVADRARSVADESKAVLPTLDTSATLQAKGGPAAQDAETVPLMLAYCPMLTVYR